MPAALTALIITMTAMTVYAASAPDYHITATVPLGAPDRWDYVVHDPVSGRVYVAHGDRVSVVDGASDKVVGAILLGKGGVTHSI